MQKILPTTLTALATILLLFFISQPAQATATYTTCSTTYQPGASGLTAWTAIPTTPPIDQDCQERPNVVLIERGTGDSITLQCQNRMIGTLGAAIPDNIFIYAIPDNLDYPLNGAPTNHFWTSTHTGTTCNNNLATFYCTHDGTNTGNPRFGLVRIVIRAVRTGIGSYDTNSDQTDSNGGYDKSSGVIRCDPKISTFTDAIAGGASPTTYVGGDTLRTTLTLTGPDYKPANLGNIILPCNTGTANAGAASFTTATTTLNTIIQGTFQQFPDDCTIKQNLTLTRNSELTDINTQKYVRWNTTNAPADVTFPTVNGQTLLTAVRDAKPLDRTLTASSCAIHLNAGAHPTITIVNRGEALENHCTWKNARNENTPTGRIARAYTIRSSQPWRDTTDFLSADASFGASSDLSYATTAKTTATTSTGLLYRQQIETFGDSTRADGVLFNVGNSTGLFDVKSAWSFAGINMTKLPGEANVSLFTISLDQEFATARILTNARGEILTGKSVTCFRTKPNSDIETGVSMGTTDSNGDSQTKEFQVIPPQGEWDMTCTTSENGNSASYTVSFFHTSGVTSGTNIAVSFNVTSNTTGTWANISAIIRYYEGACDCVEKAFPDDLVKLTLQAYNTTSAKWDIVITERTIMQPPIITESNYNTTIKLNNSYMAFPILASVTTNITGKPFIALATYLNQTSTTINNGDTMSMIPTETAVPMAFAIIMIATIALPFVSRTNPIPSILSVILLLIIGALTLTNQETLGDNFYLFIFAIAITLALCAWRMVAIILTTQENEN